MDARCSKCGHRTSGSAASCPACGTGLLVDVVVDVQAADSRAIYLAAREIDELGGEAPVFAEIKTRLQAAPGVIARECSRGDARGLTSVLERHGFVVRLTPVRRTRRTMLGARGLDALGLVVAKLKILNRNLPASIKAPIAGLLVVLVLVVTIGRDRPQQEEEHGEVPLSPAAMHTLSSREIAFAAVASTARLSCAGKSATGFFIDAERLVTNAHVLPADTATIQVEMAGGRQLNGFVEGADPWLDLALVRVPGAAAKALPLGDVTLLEQGDSVMAAGYQQGLELTVAQGIVSHPSRVLMGVTYLQIDVGIRSGNSGGPILDRSGKVVGVAAMTVAASSSPGLAIPVNYLYSGAEPLLVRPRQEDERSRWNERLALALEEEQKELASVRTSAARPAVIAARLVRRDMVEVALVRFATSQPPGERLTLDLLDNGVRLCEPTVEISWWQPLTRQAAEMKSSRYLRWLMRHGVPGQVYAGTSSLDLRGCPGPEALVGSQLILNDGDQRADRVLVEGSSRVSSIAG